MILEYIGLCFLMLGSFFCAVAALGVLRMPDVYIRLHAATKAGTLGLGMIMIGVAFVFNELTVVSRVIVIILFILITAPVGSHMLGRASLYMGIMPWKNDRKESTKPKKVKTQMDKNKSDVKQDVKQTVK